MRRQAGRIAQDSDTFEAAAALDENLGGSSSERHGQDWGNHLALATAHRKRVADQEDTLASGG